MAPLILVVFICQYTKPIMDGDLWFQMAYGRYMVENLTLIPDHSIYTWSEADTSVIYCTWISEIILYLIYSAGGIWALFVFRYVCTSVLIVIPLWFARRVGVLRHPLTWFICLLGLMMTLENGALKPQAFSDVLICLAAANWMYIKVAGDKAWKYCYLFPLIMLIWVNSHGGFLFGGLFMFAIGAGEQINYWSSNSWAFSKKTFKHLRIALCLAALSIFLTPYGWIYLQSLMDFMLGYTTQDYKSVAEYDTIFLANKKSLYLVDYLIAASCVLTALIVVNIPKKRIDWAILLTNGFMIYLYVTHIRLVAIWAPVFIFTAIYLLSQAPGLLNTPGVKAGFGAVIVLIAFFLGGRVVSELLAPRLVVAKYFGLGISYLHPVEEAKYIRSHLGQYKIGNDYNNGSYLLWALHSETKVFIDSRYFPFQKWIDEYHSFVAGDNIPEFLDKYKADVWCISLFLHKPVGHFLKSPEWRPVFYGPSSAVFVRTDLLLAQEKVLSGKGLDDIKNLYHGLQAGFFAATIKDWDGASRIIKGMKRRFIFKRQKKIVAMLQTYIQGMMAYEQKEFLKAAKLMGALRNQESDWGDKTLVNALNHLAAAYLKSGNIQKAVQMVQGALFVQPDNPRSKYNMGILLWELETSLGAPIQGQDYRACLQAFLDTQESRKSEYKEEKKAAEAIIKGLWDQPLSVSVPDISE